jgi:hypothetical protein
MIEDGVLCSECTFKLYIQEANFLFGYWGIESSGRFLTGVRGMGDPWLNKKSIKGAYLSDFSRGEA